MTAGQIEFDIRANIIERIAIQQRLLADDSLIETIGTVGKVMAGALRHGRKLFFMGNGGSAADAQHLAAEFTGRYRVERKPLPAIALTVNTSSLTAIANDYSFDVVFARQLAALGSQGDVAIGFSTSGVSANILEAMVAARSKSLVTVGVTGELGGLLKSKVDYCLCVPSRATPAIQESHIMIGHLLCEIVEAELFA
jgi:D-sedoheptulose 7-phosphate isomerase